MPLSVITRHLPGVVLGWSFLSHCCCNPVLFWLSVRKETGNSSHPHSSCTIPPILLQWRWLALATGGQELSHSEGQKDRSLFMPLLGWGSCWGCLLSSFLYCFSFRSSFHAAQPKHPVFKTSDCFATEELLLWGILLKCKTILIQEVMNIETRNLMNTSKKAICLSRTALTRLTELEWQAEDLLDIPSIMKNSVSDLQTPVDHIPSFFFWENDLLY